MGQSREAPVGMVAFACALAAFALGAGPSVGVRDSGELTTAAALVDVAHPTGFVLDMALARAAMWLVPAGDLAFRANVLVAVLMALAAALGARVAFALAEPLPAPARAALAALPVAALIASPTTLRAGTAMEVYAAALAVALGCVWLFTAPEPSLISHAARRRLAAFALGATVLLHTSARPAALLALALLCARAPRPRAPLRTALALATCAALPALAVLELPVSAARGGPIDWGDPRTPARLWQHLSAARIRAAFAPRMFTPWRVPGDLAHVASVLREDLGAVLLALGAVGAVLSVRDARARWIAVLVLGDVAYAALVNPMGVGDRQTLFLAEAGLALLAAYALARALAPLLRRSPAPRTARLAAALVALFALATLARTDTAHAARADGWTATEVLGGAGALDALPPRALVLCESDDLCGGSLYARYVEGERPDVTVLPRQHLADPSTWRRARPEALGAPLPAVDARGDLRVARLRALVAAFGPRLRWESGEVDDERLAAVAPASAETPALGTLGAPATDADARADEWLAPRVARGAGARRLAASVLFAAGRRIAARDLAAAVPLWERALAYDPDHAGAYTNLGVVRAREGDLAGAVQLTERAVALDPERPVAWRNLARYRAALGDAEGAQAATDEFLRRSRGR